MARFKNQVNKGIEAEPETKNQKPENKEKQPETKNQKPEDSISDGAQQMNYSESDLELVNVAGFKVPYVVREHWKKGCREKRVKLSPMLKRILVNEFGLPPGLTLDDI